MSHKDSPTGQQFHVRYSRDEEGAVRTYWSAIHNDRADAEETARVYTDHRNNGARIYDIKVFVRNVSPWREDVPGGCARCGCPEQEHRWITEIGTQCGNHDACPEFEL